MRNPLAPISRYLLSEEDEEFYNILNDPFWKHSKYFWHIIWQRQAHRLPWMLPSWVYQTYQPCHYQIVVSHRMRQKFCIHHHCFVSYFMHRHLVEASLCQEIESA